MYTTLWPHFPRTTRKTPRSSSPIGHIPVRAANQTRHAPSWHKQCAIRQVFTYVHCVHMRSAATPAPVPKPCNIRGSIRPLKNMWGLARSRNHPPTCHSSYPGPAECAKRLNNTMENSVFVDVVFDDVALVSGLRIIPPVALSTGTLYLYCYKVSTHAILHWSPPRLISYVPH